MVARQQRRLSAQAVSYFRASCLALRVLVFYFAFSAVDPSYMTAKSIDIDISHIYMSMAKSQALKGHGTYVHCFISRVHGATKWIFLDLWWSLLSNDRFVLCRVWICECNVDEVVFWWHTVVCRGLGVRLLLWQSWLASWNWQGQRNTSTISWWTISWQNGSVIEYIMIQCCCSSWAEALSLILFLFFNACYYIHVTLAVFAASLEYTQDLCWLIILFLYRDCAYSRLKTTYSYKSSIMCSDFQSGRVYSLLTYCPRITNRQFQRW